MKALLVIGIHREERAFGEAVAAGMSRRDLDVLVVEDGLSGQRPRPDQRYRYDTLHGELYSQLPAQVAGRYGVLIDLHTGLDRSGPSVDLICADPARLAALPARFGADRVRVVALGGPETGRPRAETVIPESVWRHPDFLYVGVEVFLPESGAGTQEQQAFARGLVEALAAEVRPEI